MKKIFKIENIITFILIVALVWIILSWFEVVTHNSVPNTEYTYSTINLFKMIFDK